MNLAAGPVVELAGGVGGAVGAGGAPAGAVPPPFDRPAADKHA